MSRALRVRCIQFKINHSEFTRPQVGCIEWWKRLETWWCRGYTGMCAIGMPP